MNIEIITKNDVKTAVITAEKKILTDLWAMLDLIIYVRGKIGLKNMALARELIAEEFFDMDTGLAKKIMARLTKFGMRCAIYGDFSQYSSTFADFITECNSGDILFFVPTKEIAAERLSISLA